MWQPPDLNGISASAPGLHGDTCGDNRRMMEEEEEDAMFMLCSLFSRIPLAAVRR
jgi:hypothetical protein